MPIKDWSTTPASNNSEAPYGAKEGMTLANVNDVMRQMMADTRQLCARDTIASAASTDLGSKDATFLTVSGTTTITGFGTVSDGIYKFVYFSGALTLTHNATSLILKTGANRTTVAGDTALFLSEGSGNWREIFYFKVGDYQPLDADLTAIAALTTTAFGRGMLEYADAAAAFAAIKQAASETATGVVELATTSEAVIGTDTTMAVTPAGVTAAIAAYGAQSLGASGYKVLPGGLIVQWGAGVGGTAVTFPVAFPTAFVSASISIYNAGSNEGSNISVTSKTGMTAYTYNSSGVATFANFYWIALGY